MLVLGGMGDGGTTVLTLKEMLSARPAWMDVHMYMYMYTCICVTLGDFHYYI